MSQHRHKVFVSFYDEDQYYKRQFVNMMGDRLVNRSVGYGDIDDTVNADTIMRNIREDFIADATVTVVLIGPCTWQRKYVDWEIASSLRDTAMNSRCGLLGVLLPNHPDFGKQKCNSNLVPPRLIDNTSTDNSFASICLWSDDPIFIQSRIDYAFHKRDKILPDNSRPLFTRNRGGNCLDGWQS